MSAYLRQASENAPQGGAGQVAAKKAASGTGNALRRRVKRIKWSIYTMIPPL